MKAVFPCDGRLVVQGNSDPINRMVTTPSSIQADLSYVVHSSYRPICHSSNHKLPLYVSPVPDQQSWKIDTLRLAGSYSIHLPSPALLHWVIQKISQCNCLIILINSQSLARDALVLGHSAALNGDPTPIGM